MGAKVNGLTSSITIGTESADLQACRTRHSIEMLTILYFKPERNTEIVFKLR